MKFKLKGLLNLHLGPKTVTSLMENGATPLSLNDTKCDPRQWRHGAGSIFD